MKKPPEQLVRIQDNQSSTRKSFLKKWFANSYDGLRFFWFLAEQTRLPILGRYFIRPAMESYYHNFEPGSYILPSKEIEAVIHASTHLSIDPCICRIFNGHCDNPLYTCLKINFAARLRQEETGRGVTRQEALEIVKNARRHGLILVLEHCIRPYQYNICMCCACCCVPMKFRYQFGLDVYHNGPYLPELDDHKCQNCGVCEQKCPVSAISKNNGKITIDGKRCLGCGICENTCPNDVITMVKGRPVDRDEGEPGRINLLFKRLYLNLVLIPQVMLFKLFKGSEQYKVERVPPRPKDVYTMRN